jgi:hypothetical protein
MAERGRPQEGAVSRSKHATSRCGPEARLHQERLQPGRRSCFEDGSVQVWRHREHGRQPYQGMGDTSLIQSYMLTSVKNCAFVDFKTPSAYQAAVAANPHTVNGIELKVEERRQPQQSFRGGGFSRGVPRGRGAPGGPPRGGFQPRGGRGGPPRGRGAPQEA